MNQRSILRVSAGTSASVSTEPRAATAERTSCFPNWSKRVRIHVSKEGMGQTRGKCGHHERHAAHEHTRPRSLVSCRLKNIGSIRLGVSGNRDKPSDGGGISSCVDRTSRRASWVRARSQRASSRGCRRVGRDPLATVVTAAAARSCATRSASGSPRARATHLRADTDLRATGSPAVFSAGVFGAPHRRRRPGQPKSSQE